MIGKISKDGLLSIKRKEIWKEQFCPYDNDSMCGDYCPAFTDVDIIQGISLACASNRHIINIELDER